MVIKIMSFKPNGFEARVFLLLIYSYLMHKNPVKIVNFESLQALIT